jgi:two-component system, cell cycle sensor histidine kinase and response regulator CckA
MAGAPRILVVDDEEPIRTFAQRTLEASGFQVIVASSAAEALDIVQREAPFDLFVLDVNLPDMTGYDLARQLRRDHDDRKILYFTGYSDQLFNHKPALWADEAFLEKPATMAALREAVSLLLFHHPHGPQRAV